MQSKEKEIRLSFLKSSGNVGIEITRMVSRILHAVNVEFYNAMLVCVANTNGKKLNVSDVSKEVGAWLRPGLDDFVANESSNSKPISAFLRKPAQEKQNYYTVPHLNDIKDFTSVTNFIIGRKGYGEIKWQEPVDLSNVGALDDIVVIERSKVALYEFMDEPSEGTGLNKPATIFLNNIRPAAGINEKVENDSTE